jgi:carbon-monoxide dehydrogenase iron sulfur subunit
MRNIILIDSDKCVGCRHCTLACSFTKESLFSLAKARNTTFWMYTIGRYVPMMCRHCARPPCLEACPVEAISRKKDTGAVVINPDECVGCKLCMEACPLGGVTWDEDSMHMIKCDLCDGDPACVRHCMYGALTWVNANEAAVTTKQKGARRVAEAIVKCAE